MQLPSMLPKFFQSHQIHYQPTNPTIIPATFAATFAATIQPPCQPSLHPCHCNAATIAATIVAEFKFLKDAGHYFKISKLQQYLWLAYSKQQNGGICLQVFSPSKYGMHVKHLLTQFSKALELLEKQTAKEYHKIAVVWAEEFLQVMRGQQYNIYQYLDQAVSDQLEEIQLHCVT